MPKDRDPFADCYAILCFVRTSKRTITNTNTASDPYSGHGYSGNDGFSGTKTPDDAILFTVSGITAVVEQKFRKFRFFQAQSYKRRL